MNSRSIPLLALALLLAAAGAQAAPSTEVTVQTVHKQTLSETVPAYGRVASPPGSMEWLSAAQGGRVSSILVQPGSRVQKGQAIVRITATPQTQAAYASARSALTAAKSKLEQTRTLEKNGLATRADLASAQDAYDSARARLTALQAEGVGPHAQTLKAAAAGVVAQLPVARGEWVTAGTHIAALAPRGGLQVRLGVPPAQAMRIQSGAEVSLAPVFGAGQSFHAKVSRVAGQADAATGLIDAEVPLKGHEDAVFPGEWLSATIVVSKSDLPAVKRSAVLHDKQGNYVFVVSRGKAHRVNVQVLSRAGGLVGIKGVEPGAIVVTQGNFELNDGDAVRIRKAGAAAS